MILPGGAGAKAGGPGGGSPPEQHTRTTAMLVAVVICFVVVELPLGVLALMGGICMDVFDRVIITMCSVRQKFVNHASKPT